MLVFLQDDLAVDGELVLKIDCFNDDNSYRNEVERHFYATWENIIADLNEVDYDPATYAEHFALLMLDEMINKFI